MDRDVVWEKHSSQSYQDREKWEAGGLGGGRPRRKVWGWTVTTVREVLASVPAEARWWWCGQASGFRVSQLRDRVPALPSCVLRSSISLPSHSFPNCEKGKKSPSSDSCVTVRADVCTVPGMHQARGRSYVTVYFPPALGAGGGIHFSL